MGTEQGEPTPAGWEALARAVRQRRQWLQLSHSGVARRGGPSHETIRLVETAGRPSFRDMTLAQLDRALGWKPGIAKAITTETAPADPAAWIADNSAAELELRADAMRHGAREPEGMAPLPMSLDDVPDIELAGELVSRLTKGRDPGRNRQLLEELMGLLTRLSAEEFGTHPRSA